MTDVCETFPEHGRPGPVHVGRLGRVLRRQTPASVGAVRIALASLAVAVTLAGCGTEPSAEVAAQWHLLDTYCTDCHSAAEATAGLVLEARQPDEIAADAEVWEHVVRKLRSRMMPPSGNAQPSTIEVDAFVAALEQTLDAARPVPEPGHVTLRRLNRTEYANAIEDLLTLEVDAAALLPVDGSAEGFDKVASALQVSPSFMDQYLTAARTLSARALGNPQARAAGTPYTISAAGQEFHVPGLPLGTRGGAVVEHDFPTDGEYLLNIGNLVTGLWGFNQEHRNTLIATLDGERFFELEIGGGEDLRELDQIGAPAVDRINAQLKNIPFETTAGVHRIGITFLHRSFAESDRKLRSLVPGRGQDAVLKLSGFEIFGPVSARGISETPSRRAVFSCYPNATDDEARCAEEVVEQLSARAFRGTGTRREIEQLMRLYERGRQSGGFEGGIEYALAGVLAHPKFLYRLEDPPEDLADNGAYELDGTALASRLSFFLWSSIPDQSLLDAASDGTLTDAAVFESQVRRMLADPRAQTLASDFAYQWLGLGELDSVDPDPQIFRDIDRDIRAHFIEEISRFVDSVFSADGSVLELLSAQHTYLNETLALHYGINGVRGARFRRVELDDPGRFGLLGKGGVLMAASYPNRTSPVLRGAWLLEHLFGTPPADPPPDVEALIENVEGRPAATVRERLEVHRDNPSCNSCHGVIDPLGFALESFDAVGRWRERDRFAGTVIDASGVLVDGRSINGPVELREAILERPEQFLQAFTEKLMIYAIGRSLDYRDMPTVRRIVREAAEADYRFTAIVLGIVSSPQFRMQQVPAPDAQSVTADLASGQ